MILAWMINYTTTARRQLRKMDKSVAKWIVDYMDERVATLSDPRTAGKALRGKLSNFWRYRVGDYRIICELEDKKLTILILDVDHRKSVYL